ncbi:MAG: hypothetical protein R3F40_10350 [Candidatus Competibacteraceae bacterium]
MRSSREAIRCLAECGDAKDSNVLLQALEDVGWRSAQRPALARLGSEPVLQHLSEPRPSMARPCVQSCGRFCPRRMAASASAEQRQAALPVYLEQRGGGDAHPTRHGDRQ